METLEDLINKHKQNRIPYRDLLNTLQWQTKRNAILKRDNNVCQACRTPSSYYFTGYNLLFNNTFEIDYFNFVSTQQISVPELKSILAVDKIPVYKSPINQGDYFGLTSKGQIILINYNEAFISINSKLNVWPVMKTEYGNKYLITPENDNLFFYKSFINPTIIDAPTYLHVHHKLYFLNTFPWDYEDEHLITLCNYCHTNLHSNTAIPVYKNKTGFLVDLKLTKCKRCNGAGVFPEFSHINEGICFKCEGANYEELCDIH